MFSRRNSSDSAIGWISTVDSLLLGFGLMFAIALHLTMKQKDADRTVEELKQEKQTVSQLQDKDKASQKAIEELQAKRDDLQAERDELQVDLEQSVETIKKKGRELETISDDRTKWIEEAWRLKEQFDANVLGVKGINEKLEQALLERDSLRRQQDNITQQLNRTRNDLEDVTRKLTDSAAELARETKEKDSLEAAIVETRAQLLVLQDQQKTSATQSDELNLEASRLRKAIDTKAIELETMRQSLAKKDREIGELKAEQSKVTDLLDKAKEDAVKTRARLDEANRILAAQEKEKAAFGEQQRGFKKVEDQLKAKVAEGQAAIAKGRQLQGQLDLKKKELVQVERNLKDAEAGRLAAEKRLQWEASEKGQAAATDVLGFKGQFKNVVFIIDISESMIHASDPVRLAAGVDTIPRQRWNKTKREIVSWARHLPMESLRLVVFNSKVYEYPGNGNAFSMKGNDRAEAVRVLERGLGNVVPKGQTNTPAAFRKAYSYPGIDTMILFTDGQPFLEGSDQNALIAEVKGLVRQHRNIPVNVVGIGEYFDESFAGFLRDIADATDGEFIGR